uniref:Integrase, catalytic region, zinc finger, CCHC-type, peptidase aspartic, catalytic n=1 Tax=Tanacetum cinerariifolium TaxID=118510 RepID=A0A699I1K9_TANCI|nr:hypothetical protein [Tanacetum cinerariifolium]
MKVTKQQLVIKILLYLTQAQRKVPTLYCGNTIVKQHDALSIIDTEETLDLVEEKQAFWLPISKLIFEIPPIQPELVLKEIPRDLPTITLVKDSFNKLRNHVNDFENVVTFRTKVTGQYEGSWGFEYIWKAFEKDAKHFVKTLKDYFYMFDQEKKSFKIKEKKLLLENDRLLELIISQDLVHIVVNSLAETIDYQSMEKSFLDEYSECVELKDELSKKNEMVEKAVYNELSKQCARMENIYFEKVVEKIESLQLLEVMVRSLETDMNKTLRIKNGRDEEESMGRKKDEDKAAGTSIWMVKDAEKGKNGFRFVKNKGVPCLSQFLVDFIRFVECHLIEIRQNKKKKASTRVTMTSLADKAILSSADNRPPMLEKDMYDSWKSRMEMYMLNRQHGRMILKSVENGPLLWPTVEEDGVTRLKKYSELLPAEAIQADCDVKTTNIILQGLPPKVYALVTTHKVAKEFWERIQMLMQGTSLTKQERECKLYDEFDKFAYLKGETLRDFYLRFSLLLNDMNMYNMKLEQFQVNTKFLNTLPPEWSKFVTDVKLVRDLHTTNVDQLHAYLGQHEYHANEVRLMHERTLDPLALISQYQMNRSTYQHHQQSYHQPQFQQQASTYQSSRYATSYHTPQYVSQAPSSSNLSISYPPNDIPLTVNHNTYMASSLIPQINYALTVH